MNGGKGNLGVWNGHLHMLYLKWIMNKDLLYNTWILLSVIWQPGWEGSLGENGYMYIYMGEPLCYSQKA